MLPDKILRQAADALTAAFRRSEPLDLSRTPSPKCILSSRPSQQRFHLDDDGLQFIRYATEKCSRWLNDYPAKVFEEDILRQFVADSAVATNDPAAARATLQERLATFFGQIDSPVVWEVV